MTNLRSNARLGRLLGVLMALLIASGTGVAFSSQAAIAQAQACWDQAPTVAPGYKQWATPPNMVIDPAKKYTATIETSMGKIVIDLYADKAPTTVNNFVCLAQNKYYDVILFHRIISGFMIQTGDPSGTGAGGPGYQFADELPGDDLNYEVGSVAMANAGPNTNGSQFFIVQGDQGTQLPKNYTIFGKVSSGMEVVDAIAAVPVGANARGEQSVPIDRVWFQTIAIQES
jgi:cyclophilin family peptidyl-prolyl cis-trans isomerase